MSRTIGTERGRLEIAEAGVTIVVPEGALDAPVRITVTALAGEHMAFDLQPHGLRFLRPATIEVDVNRTEAADGLRTTDGAVDVERFLGVLFEGDPTLGVEPLETLPAYRKGGTVAFDGAYFRGYVCATG